MKPGNNIAWGGAGRVPAHQAYGGQAIDARPVAAGGMEWEGDSVSKREYVCTALTKKGDYCTAKTVNDTSLCQGHTVESRKLQEKIASTPDEVERISLEEEKRRRCL